MPFGLATAINLPSVPGPVDNSESAFADQINLPLAASILYTDPSAEEAIISSAIEVGLKVQASDLVKAIFQDNCKSIEFVIGVNSAAKRLFDPEQAEIEKATSKTIPKETALLKPYLDEKKLVAIFIRNLQDYQF